MEITAFKKHLVHDRNILRWDSAAAYIVLKQTRAKYTKVEVGRLSRLTAYSANTRLYEYKVNCKYLLPFYLSRN